jgi:hypothetical protein
MKPSGFTPEAWTRQRTLVAALMKSPIGSRRAAPGSGPGLIRRPPGPTLIHGIAAEPLEERPMHVFICWSGQRSGRLARALHEQWLPTLLDDLVSSFVSSSDIERGERWFDRLLDELRKAEAAIVCLTPENLDSRWMHFEAGMVYGHAHVFPYFLGEETGQIQDPLSGVQATATSASSRSA